LFLGFPAFFFANCLVLIVVVSAPSGKAAILLAPLAVLAPNRFPVLAAAANVLSKPPRGVPACDALRPFFLPWCCARISRWAGQFRPLTGFESRAEAGAPRQLLPHLQRLLRRHPDDGPSELAAVHTQPFSSFPAPAASQPAPRPRKKP